jgi:hypothetical protein
MWVKDMSQDGVEVVLKMRDVLLITNAVAHSRREKGAQPANRRRAKLIEEQLEAILAGMRALHPPAC